MHFGFLDLSLSIQSFCLTFVIEGAVLLFFKEFRKPRALTILFFTNMLTYPPYLLLRANLFPDEKWLLGVALFEPIVFFVEAFLYSKLIPLNRNRAILVSVISNLASISIGLIGRLLVHA